MLAHLHDHHQPPLPPPRPIAPTGPQAGQGLTADCHQNPAVRPHKWCVPWVKPPG